MGQPWKGLRTDWEGASGQLWKRASGLFGKWLPVSLGIEFRSFLDSASGQFGMVLPVRLGKGFRSALDRLLVSLEKGFQSVWKMASGQFGKGIPVSFE